MSYSITCPDCARVPREKIILVRFDGHVWIQGSTGGCIACSTCGGYFTTLEELLALAASEKDTEERIEAARKRLVKKEEQKVARKRKWSTERRIAEINRRYPYIGN